MAKRPQTIDRGHAQEVRVTDLSGGVNLRVSPTLASADQARTLRNFSLREPGTLSVDYGFTRFTTSTFGSGRAQGGQRVYLKNAQVFTLVAENGVVKDVSDAGVVGSSLVTGLNTANEIYFPYDRDLVAVLDGASVPKKSTNKTTWTQFGITAPVAPTLALVAGGSLIVGNTYEVSYTYQDDELLHESSTSPVATIAPTSGNQIIRVTVTNSGDSQVDRKNIYVRNVTAGQTVRRKVGETTGTTFDIDGPDTDWENGQEVPTNHGVAPALRYAVVWKNRWWGLDSTVKNRIYFTEIFQNQSWAPLFFIDVPLDRGDDLTTLLPHGDTLLAYGQNSLVLIIGQTSLDFEVRPALGVEYGCVGPRGVARVENGVIHAAHGGVFLWDGASDRLLSFDISPAWEDMVKNSTSTNIGRVALVYHKQRKEVRIAVPRLFPTGTTGEWILDLDRSRSSRKEVWTSAPRLVGGYIYFDGAETTTGNRERLFSWASNEGHLYEEVTGFDANGADLVAEYESSGFTFGFTVVRWVAVYGEYRPAAGQFGIEVVVDGVSQGSQTIPLTGAGTLYGVDEYGQFTYGGKERVMFSILLPLTAEGRVFVLKARYQGKARLQLYTFAVEAVPEPLPRGIS